MMERVFLSESYNARHSIVFAELDPIVNGLLGVVSLSRTDRNDFPFFSKLLKSTFHIGLRRKHTNFLSFMNAFHDQMLSLIKFGISKGYFW